MFFSQETIIGITPLVELPKPALEPREHALNYQHSSVITVKQAQTMKDRFQTGDGTRQTEAAMSEEGHRFQSIQKSHQVFSKSNTLGLFTIPTQYISVPEEQRTLNVDQVNQLKVNCFKFSSSIYYFILSFL